MAGRAPGVEVDLYEMRPQRSGPAHTTGALAELVCSNSFRGAALENAVGLLKEELARLGSLIVSAARENAVPAGGALAVDRARFAEAVEARIAGNPRITLRREECNAIPLDRPAIVACGPLPSEEFLASFDALLGGGRLHYYDAASPIVAADSIDETAMFWQSRYDKGPTTGSGQGDDYLNIPLDRAQYAQLLDDLRTLERHAAKSFEETRYFEGCLPIEEMADRGDDVLRFGPLKPVGLARSAHRPDAVRGRATAQRERRRHRLQSRRISDAACVARAARGVREASGFGKCRVAAAGRDASQHVHRFAASARRTLAAATDRARSISPGRSPAPRGTSKRRPAAR